ncbi:YciI family protein [Fodinicola feengrottensis]|uniref:YciI family protein n=1 Tax=Fodinicola feengrottensis TaxID=435914 RepID=A0ABN2I104_9ACTN|nr:YciI family protein [Fodinicola feengrottensis]
MKYMLMIFQNPAVFEALSKDEQTAVMNEAGALWQELADSGEWVSGEALFAASTAKAVRTRGGVPAVTDGPYIEAKEQLAGLLIVDVASEERAVEIAGRWPDARYWGMEVRQLIEQPEG